LCLQPPGTRSPILLLVVVFHLLTWLKALFLPSPVRAWFHPVPRSSGSSGHPRWTINSSSYCLLAAQPFFRHRADRAPNRVGRQRGPFPFHQIVFSPRVNFLFCNVDMFLKGICCFGEVYERSDEGLKAFLRASLFSFVLAEAFTENLAIPIVFDGGPWGSPAQVHALLCLGGVIDRVFLSTRLVAYKLQPPALFFSSRPIPLLVGIGAAFLREKNGPLLIWTDYALSWTIVDTPSPSLLFAGKRRAGASRLRVVRGIFLLLPNEAHQTLLPSPPLSYDHCLCENFERHFLSLLFRRRGFSPPHNAGLFFSPFRCLLPEFSPA